MSDNNDNNVEEKIVIKQVEKQIEQGGKVWSDDYVQELREESKDKRLKLKAEEVKRKKIESDFRKLMGLNENDVLNDETIQKYQQKIIDRDASVLKKANEKLLLAEIKSQEGYDPKLVGALLDKSKVEIADDGTITGLTEALVELEKEYPSIKVSSNRQTGANPPNVDNLTEIEQLQKLQEDYLKAGNLAASVAMKNKIFELNKK